jgi:hypothetical protein
MNDLTITVPRTDLIQTLTDKRTALEVEWDAEIQRVTDERDNLPNTALAMKDWHIEVAAMLSAGEAKTTGKGEIIASDPSVKEVPERPTVSGQRGTKRDFTQQIEDAQGAKKQALGKIDTSLRLLNLATNVDIEIPVSQYEGLLSGTVRSAYGRYSR